MADKEATVYIVDVGQSMADRFNDGQTKLEFALTYVWDKITSIMALDRKTTLQGVVAVRTDDTENDLSDGDPDYQHISVRQPLKALALSDLHRLKQTITPSGTENGDAISALVIAIDMIAKTCKKLKYIRRIIMITSGQGSWSEDNIGEISRKLAADGIELTVLGVDFGPKQEDSKTMGFSEVMKSNCELIWRLMPSHAGDDSLNNIFAPIEDAVAEMDIPRLKRVRPVPSYRGQLLLGDPMTYDDALCIDVERYPRTMLRKPVTASSFIANGSDNSTGAAGPTGSAGDTNEGGDLALIRNQRMYEVVDVSLPNGRKEVPFDELAKGYEYGRTAVHVSESDVPILKMETLPALEIIGFIPAENFERYMVLSRSNVILAQRSNTKAIMALSSLVHALHELSSAAIARLVSKADQSPEIVLLAPVIEPEAEYLVDVLLPFAEDVRGYAFPPLDRVVLTSGKSLSEHRHLPDAKLQSSMDAYIEAMDLDGFEASHEEGSWDPSSFAGRSHAEYDAFSPLPHRIDTAIRHRAIQLSSDILPPGPMLTKYSAPPSDLVPNDSLSNLIDAAAVKKVPAQSAATRRQRTRDSAATTLSGLDVTALLAKRTPDAPRVDPDNPIPTFRQMLDTTRDPEGILKAAKQFGEVIEAHVRHNVGGRDDARIIEELKTLKTEMVEMEEPGIWNEWAAAFRQKVLRGDLGGERRELWWKIRGEGSNVSLIEEGRHGVSNFVANEFWSLKT